MDGLYRMTLVVHPLQLHAGPGRLVPELPGGESHPAYRDARIG
jgi:hypothetical protein